MSEATLSFSDPDQIPILLGTHDCHIRQIEDSLGVSIVHRNDELRIIGDDSLIQKSLRIFAELKAIIQSTGELSAEQVQTALYNGSFISEQVKQVPTTTPSSIDLFEKTKKVHPRTPGQSGYIKSIGEHDLVFCTGPAGCGKTFLAVAMAIHALRTESVRKIVLVRPAVEAGEKLGFLPGDMLAKVNPFLRPLLDALGSLLDFDQVNRYMENDIVEVVPLAFMRGRTLDNTFIIMDEAQNTTVTQMKMFLTRMGMGSQIVVTGDISQIDLPPDISCGMTDAITRLRNIKGVGVVQLKNEDIVRHRLVGEIVKAYQNEDTMGH
ncbi:MAG: PhoH family protein [Planctomycetes bacterium]|nr:PhoH family protein [Planctomycetota bacterium]MCH9726427.1 PhoH family protein [Planctomycetota bacterium]MCH9778236.1 PhoH family protein [Planctomycetota bacterium]MDF1745678.1 PhoH family protein [Gimesia sp.]